MNKFIAFLILYLLIQIRLDSTLDILPPDRRFWFWLFFSVILGFIVFAVVNNVVFLWKTRNFPFNNSIFRGYKFRYYVFLIMSLTLASAGLYLGLTQGRMVSWVGGIVGMFLFIRIIIVGREIHQLDENN